MALSARHGQKKTMRCTKTKNTFGTRKIIAKRAILLSFYMEIKINYLLSAWILK
jgi:hypothetical protein